MWSRDILKIRSVNTFGSMTICSLYDNYIIHMFTKVEIIYNFLSLYVITSQRLFSSWCQNLSWSIPIRPPRGFSIVLLCLDVCISSFMDTQLPLPVLTSLLFKTVSSLFGGWDSTSSGITSSPTDDLLFQ